MADKVQQRLPVTKIICDLETLAIIEEKRWQTQPQNILPGIQKTAAVPTVIRFSCNAVAVAAQTIIITFTAPTTISRYSWATTITLVGGETRAQVNAKIALALAANSTVFTGSNTVSANLAAGNFSAPTGASPSTMDLTYTATWRSYYGGLPENPVITIAGTYGSCSATVTTPGNQAVITSVERQDISENTAWEIRTTSPLTLTARNEYQETEYSFPALLFGLILNGASTRPNPYTGLSSNVIKINYNFRPAKRRMVTMRIAVDYSTVEPTPPVIFNFPTTAVIYSGVLFSLNMTDVLIDELSLSVMLSDDATWGDFIETFSQDATDITATQYLDTIVGTEKIVSFRSEKWKYCGLWRNLTFYLTMQ